MKVIGKDGSVREATGEDLAEVWRRRRRRDAELLRQEQEAWDEGLRIEEENKRKMHPLTRPLQQFETFVTEKIPDGFGGLVTRVRRRFRPPQNF